jgi:hypothetical protein
MLFCFQETIDMGIILMDNRNSLYSSYVRGWELALRIMDEEMARVTKDKKNNSSKRK